MSAIDATFKNGQIVPDGPPDWPEGARLRIEPVDAEQVGEMSNGNQPETQEQIEDWLRWYHALEPLEFTPDEEANLASWRLKTKEYDLVKSQQQPQGLFP